MVNFVSVIHFAAGPAWWQSTLAALDCALADPAQWEAVGGAFVMVGGLWYKRPDPARARRLARKAAKLAKAAKLKAAPGPVKVWGADLTAAVGAVTWAPSSAWAGSDPGQDWAPERPKERAPRVLGGPDGVGVRAALAARAVPAGPLLREAAGQIDLNLARRVAAGFVWRMRSNGKTVSDTTEAEAAAAAAHDLQLWRAGLLDGPAREGVASAAVNRSVEEDGFGESVAVMAPDDLAGLWGSALPLPGWYESRADKAARLTFERARAARPGLLTRRMDWLRSTLGGRGARAALLDRVERAAGALLGGATLDDAAERAGFTASGRSSAGDRLAQAVRRLGFGVVLSARERQAAERVNTAPGEPLSAARVAQWSARPSDGMAAVQRAGTGAPAARALARIVAKSARWRAGAERAARVAARVAVARAMAARMRRAERAAGRAAKHAGGWAERAGDGVGGWAVRAPWAGVTERAK